MRKAAEVLKPSDLWSDLGWDPCGQASFGGQLLKLYQSLDAFFVRWAASIDASEFAFPTFIEAAQLNKVGYFKSFPHLVTFPVSLDSQEEALRNFVNSGPLDDKGNVILGATAPVNQVLTPAACYHFYINLQGRALEGRNVVTTCARCFRREEYYVPLRRQWNFSMREIVCLGTADEVKDFLQSMQDSLRSVLQQLNLPVRFEQATDPFFNPAGNPQFVMQKLAPLKTEVMYGDLAIASFNFHHDHFGRAFEITRDGEAAYSGCVAFGLERWLFALLSNSGDRAVEAVSQLKVPLPETTVSQRSN
jgi:seryl-tRNA synthetase